jgi:hypothetical protein
MVDYASTPDRLVVHIPHTTSSDFAEWIQPYDVHPKTGEPVRRDLVNGITPIGYDAGFIGRYEIDATTGKVLDQQVFHDDWTWGSGGLTARNPFTSTDTLGDQFHANSGFPTDLAVERVYSGFVDHPHREVAVDDLPWEGIPSNIVRIDHDAGKVIDGYWFPGDRFAWTPTFVPRDGTAKGLGVRLTAWAGATLGEIYSKPGTFQPRDQLAPCHAMHRALAEVPEITVPGSPAQSGPTSHDLAAIGYAHDQRSVLKQRIAKLPQKLDRIGS